jgi:hypothetical protein
MARQKIKKKRRAPIEQLRETAKEAESILRRKGIHTADSSIEEIVAQRRVTLPGIPEYLPHRWTLAASRKVLANLVRIWLDETKNDRARQEDHKEFFKFIIKEMSRIEDKKERAVKQTSSIINTLKESVILNHIFAPMQEMETAHTMAQFLVDSFAVAIILKQHNTVSDYVFWFDEWTKQMEQLWIPKERLDG